MSGDERTDGPAAHIAGVDADEVLRRVAASGLDLDERAHWSLIEASPVAVVVSRADGFVAYSNPRAHQLHGMTREEYETRNIAEAYYDPADRTRLWDTLKRDGRLVDYEHRLRRKNGLPLWSRVSTSTLSTPRGSMMFAWGTDITDRKLLEDELARERARLLEKTDTLESLLENLPQGVILFDGQGRVVAHNSRVRALLDLPDALRGMSFGEIRRHLRSIGEFEHAQNRLPAGLRAASDDDYRPWLETAWTYERVRPNGTALEVRSKPIPGGGWVQAYTDITERHRASQEIVAARDRAERALADLEAAQANLLRAEKLASLGGLVAGIAHEVSTPIGVALTAATLLADRTAAMAELVAQGKVRRSDAERYTGVATEMVKQLVANITRAAEMIQRFKQVAVDRSGGGRRVFQLRPFIEEVVLSLQPRLRPARHAVTINCPDDLVLNGYPGALSQVLINFVINSLMHAFDAGQTGRIEITARATSGNRDADEVVLAFSDDGKGIPEGLQPRIFDPFFTTRRGAGGTGLGLNIVHDIVTTVLKGQIAVASRPGEGTCFEIRFPRVLPDTHPAGDAARP